MSTALNAESLAKLPLVRLEPFPRVVAVRPDDRRCREQAGFNRGPDALAALRVCDAGGVADQQDAGVDGASTRQFGDQIGVAAPTPRRGVGNFALRAKEGHEVRGGLR